MAVRNFWFEANVDGYETRPAGGPRRKDGGMEVTIYQRDDGAIETALRVICRAIGERLVTEVYSNGEQVVSYETMR